MRIGCLQFAPLVGDVDNNLNRADGVLNKANPDELSDLDILVLPEMAFSGYNFKSLQHISPFLEPTTSGISALWARTTALRYNCAVAVGYPEKVDVSREWPASPRYYNSLLVVNEEGDTVANYRKSFLYYTDETWALEGHGFFEDDVPGFGRVAMGICMDINPYRFEAPWHAFEFAFHILEVEANLVIVSMAWLTREEARAFSRFASEPDMETLTYWIQRLEPVIRSEQEEEIIVVFANRCGVEDDAVYAGTSAVLGIQHGEVSVYGLLGRGEKELLVVDTDAPAFAKLVNRPSKDSKTASVGEPVSPASARGHAFGHIEEGDSEPPSPTSTRQQNNGTAEEGEMGASVEAQKSTGLLVSPATTDISENSLHEGRKGSRSQAASLVGLTAEQSSDVPSPKFAVNKANLAISSAEEVDATSPLSSRGSRLSAYFANQDLATPPLSEIDGAGIAIRDHAIPPGRMLPTPSEPDSRSNHTLDPHR